MVPAVQFHLTGVQSMNKRGMEACTCAGVVEGDPDNMTGQSVTLDCRCAMSMCYLEECTSAKVLQLQLPADPHLGKDI